MTRLRLAAAAAAVLALAACSSAATGSAGGDAHGSAAVSFDKSATLRYATSAGVTSFDPQKTKSSSDFTLLNLVYDRLVHRDALGEPVPGLANSWEFDKGGRTLTLHLREGLKFQDGTPFNAAAVKLNLERAKQPDSITASLLTPIGAIETPNDSTVVLKLAKPGAALPLTLSDLAGMMISPQAFGTREKDAALALKPAGIGRFTLASQEPGSHYVFRAVDDYWDKAAVKVGTFDVSVVQDPQATLNGVASGGYDCAIATPGVIDPASQLANTWVKATTVLTQSILYFNRTHGELAKPEVRQAISYAIDKNSILQAAQEGHGEVATQLFPKGYFAYSKQLEELYSFDPAKAKELLVKAGLPNGFSFTAAVLNIPQFITTATIIKDSLAKIGIQMQIKAMSPADLGINFLKGDGDAVVTAWTGRPDPSNLFAAYFDAKSPQNVSKADFPGFQQAMAAADSVTDPAHRGEELGKVDQIVLKNAGVVPLTFNQVGLFCNDKVSGYEPPTGGVSEFRGVGFSR